MRKLIHFLLLGHFWDWYDRQLKEPWRFLLMLPLVIPPVYVLNGVVKTSLLTQKVAAYYLLYLLVACLYKLHRLEQE